MTKKVKVARWDAADDIKSIEDVIAHLEVAFEDGDTAEIAAMLGVVARSQGMAQIAEKTGLSREHLYKSLSEAGNPTLETLVRVLGSLGLRLAVVEREPEAA